jgi:drug/metabolite transporter (DMT)-like permease
MSAIHDVQLATASTIGFSTPILVTALSVPLLGEPVGPRRWTAVFVGFIGVLIIVRPGSDLMNPATLLLFGSSSCYALYQIVTRRSGAHDTAETGIVYAALVGTLATSLVVPFVFKPPTSLQDSLLFLGLGVFGGFGHYLVTRAFQLAPAAFVSPLGYVELLGTTVLGYLIFGNVPDAQTWLGAAIIVAAGLYIALRERKLAAQGR